MITEKRKDAIAEFYGNPVPMSQMEKLDKDFDKMFKALHKDIKAEFPEADSDKLGEAMLYGIRAMRLNGAKDPRDYFDLTKIAQAGFTYALSVLEGDPLPMPVQGEKSQQEQAESVRRDTERTRAEIEEMQISDSEFKARLATRSKISSEIYGWFGEQKRALLKAGFEEKEASLETYKMLLEKWKHQGGVDYYVVCMRIPIEHNIYEDPRCIQLWNEKASARGFALRKEPRLKSHTSDINLLGSSYVEMKRMQNRMKHE